MVSKIKIKGKNKLFENTSLQFTPVGMYIRVSLNVSPELIPFLAPNNVEQGETHWVYGLKKHIESKFINDTTFQFIQKQLLTRCMVNIREAKQKAIGKQIMKLSKFL